MSSPPRPTARRRSPSAAHWTWGACAIVLIAFAVFEAIKHGAFTTMTLVIGALGPDLIMLAGPGQRRRVGQLVYALAHRVLLPLAVLVYFTFVADSAAGFTLGLAWLAHIAFGRAGTFDRAHRGYSHGHWTRRPARGLQR